MPYLQLDVPRRYPEDAKRALARRLGDVYSRVMQTTPDRVVVAVRELPGGVWRCGDGEPAEAAVLSCEIRAGRSEVQRQALASELVEACAPVLGLPSDGVSVQFTQHPGNEMFYGGRPLPDWTTAEAHPTTR